MAARVIHFGCDDCFRVQVLRSAGYDVRASLSVAELGVVLQSDADLGAVILSESDGHDLSPAIEIARQYTLAPLILFRTSTREIDSRRFDMVYAALVPPRVWLGETAALIERCRALRAESERLCREAKTLREESQRQRARSLAELERSSPGLGWKKIDLKG